MNKVIVYFNFLILIVFMGCRNEYKNTSAIHFQDGEMNKEFTQLVSEFIDSTEARKGDIIINFYSNVGVVYFYIKKVSPSLDGRDYPRSNFELKGKTIYFETSLDQLIDAKTPKDFNELKAITDCWYIEMRSEDTGINEHTFNQQLKYRIIRKELNGKDIIFGVKRIEPVIDLNDKGL